METVEAMDDGDGDRKDTFIGSYSTGLTERFNVN